MFSLTGKIPSGLNRTFKLNTNDRGNLAVTISDNGKVTEKRTRGFHILTKPDTLIRLKIHFRYQNRQVLQPLLRQGLQHFATCKQGQFVYLRKRAVENRY